MIINNMENKIKKLITYLFFIGLIIFFAHFLLLRAFPETLYAPDVLYTHPFLFILTIIIIIILNVIFKKVKPNMLGYAFLGSSLFKMLISVLFLIPILKGDASFKKIYVVQFFVIYFIYLTMEVVYLAQQLRNKKS